MITDLICFVVGVLLGGGAVLAYLHKHTAKAVQLAAQAAGAVDSARAAVQADTH